MNAFQWVALGLRIKAEVDALKGWLAFAKPLESMKLPAFKLKVFGKKVSLVSEMIVE